MLRERPGEIHKQEEIYWKQRSWLQWLREGDDNTKVFHVVANGHNNRNFIASLLHDGLEITNPCAMGKVFVERLQQQFGSR